MSFALDHSQPIRTPLPMMDSPSRWLWPGTLQARQNSHAGFARCRLQPHLLERVLRRKHVRCAREIVFHARARFSCVVDGGPAFDLHAVHLFVEQFLKRSSANAVSMLETRRVPDACRPATDIRRSSDPFHGRACPGSRAASASRFLFPRSAIFVKHPVQRSDHTPMPTGFASSPPLSQLSERGQQYLFGALHR